MKSLIIISIFLSSWAFAGDNDVDCIEGKIRYIEFKKQVINKEDYCYDLNSKAISSTKKCISTCLSENLNPLLIKRKELISEVSSPLFLICKRAVGSPQEIEFWTGKNWVTTSRCLFIDGSFLDINHLISNRVKYED